MAQRPLAGLLATLLSSSLSFATEIATPEIPFQEYVLANGLTLVVHEDHKAPIVAVNVWYHVGSKNEKPGKTGFAHLFEHLMFNGSEHFNDDYFKVLEKIGATDLNGTTNQDRTNYFQNVPVTALDTVLWMESDRMGHLLGAIDQARLDEQRGVVQNEKRQGDNEPYALGYYLIQENTYPKGHPYSWTVIGSMEDLNAASLGDVKEWFQAYYGAANATLVIAGDVKAEEVRAKVEHYFGDIPSGPPVARHATWIAPRQGTHRMRMQDRVPEARVYEVWNTPEWSSADSDYLTLAASILSSGKTSRLYKRLVYDDQIATAVAARQEGAEIGSQFTVEATARAGGDVAAVERAAEEEMARFLAKGPSAGEVERARTEFASRFVRGAEPIGGFGGKSDILAQGLVWGGSPDFYKARLKRIQAATPAEVWGAAKRWLSDGVFVLEVQPFPEYKVTAAGADRSKRPEPEPPPAGRFPAFQRATLRNGLKIILAERHAVPAVNLRLLVDAGYAADQGGIPGTARLTGEMLNEGTKARTSLEISEELAQLGAELRVQSDLDTTSVMLSALKANLERSLDLFADAILNPSFPQADFDRLRKLQLAAIEQEKVQPFGIALRVLPRLLYGEGHAYAIPFGGTGTAASVSRLTREDVARWHTTWFKPNNATLVVVGDANLDELVPKLERLFASWKTGEVPRKNITTVAAKGQSEVYIIDRPGAVQSVILAGEVAPPKANPQEAAIETMNTVLGGQFISRLNMNLREDKHWSYGAGSVFVDARRQRPFIAYAPVQADKTSESLTEIRKELQGIRGNRPLTADELRTAQSRLTLTLPGRWETSEAVLDSLAELVRFDYEDRYFERYAERIREVTLAELAEAAKTIEADRLVWVVVGDRLKIEPGVRQLGLGEVHVTDADGNVAP